MATLTRGMSPQMCTLRSTLLRNAKHCQRKPRQGFCWQRQEELGSPKTPQGVQDYSRPPSPAPLPSHPLHTLTDDIWEQRQSSPDQVTQVPPQVHPSWELERPTICHSLGDSLSKKSDPLYLATLAKERTKEQLGNHLQIFMDGEWRNGVRLCDPRPEDNKALHTAHWYQHLHC